MLKKLPASKICASNCAFQPILVEIIPRKVYDDKKE